MPKPPMPKAAVFKLTSSEPNESIQSLTQPHAIVPIVLCAGFGTRLRPLSYAVPKVAAPMGAAGPIAWDAIRQLFEAGAPVVHVNTHYRADFVQAELRGACAAAGFDSARIRFWHEPEILETGGGIARIIASLKTEDSAYATADALVLSGDIFGEVPLAGLLDAWSAYAGDATVGGLMMSLALSEERKDKTWMSADGAWVVGFGSHPPDGMPEAQPRLFSNHQVISHRLLKYGSVKKESSVAMYYRHAHTLGLKLVHVPLAPNLRWFNVGTYPEYAECLRTLQDAPGQGVPHLLPHPDIVWAFATGQALRFPFPSALQPAGRFGTWCLPEAALAASLSQWLRDLPGLAPLAPSASAGAYAGLAFFTPPLALDLPADTLGASRVPASTAVPDSGEDPLLVPLELLLALAPSGLAPADLFRSHPLDQCYGTSQTYFVIPWTRRQPLRP